MHRMILRLLNVLLLAVLLPIVAAAQKCTITKMNTKTVKVNGRELKKGDTFILTDCKTIEWVSDDQCVEVREIKSGLTRQLTKLNVCGDDKPWSLKDFIISFKEYLTRTKVLATKELDPANQNYIDERVQLLDTLSFSLDGLYNKDQLYIAACSDGNFRERTKLPTSPDGKSVYLTRAIYGHHEPPTAATYVCILRYNTKTDEAPDSLGYLLVEALPLELK